MIEESRLPSILVVIYGVAMDDMPDRVPPASHQFVAGAYLDGLEAGVNWMVKHPESAGRMLREFTRFEMEMGEKSGYQSVEERQQDVDAMVESFEEILRDYPEPKANHGN